eukprot:NODE_7011_length_610_cov_38.786749_g6988_i0.p2 GENE.NODE_7011_length_610_cov_38.786749_g6988_i0~~NODE_7011_length_610_cov_38.786749_g6988_i0.p2  ORF type:complete len:165 (-),score=45.41 NODE_7011_length_610_cov_38.786749_g6988_i0:115-561(-)
MESLAPPVPEIMLGDDEAATKIQNRYRTHTARKEAQRRRDMHRRDRAARTVQRSYRGHAGRKAAAERREQVWRDKGRLAPPELSPEPGDEVEESNLASAYAVDDLDNLPQSTREQPDYKELEEEWRNRGRQAPEEMPESDPATPMPRD